MCTRVYVHLRPPYESLDKSRTGSELPSIELGNDSNNAGAIYEVP